MKKNYNKPILPVKVKGVKMPPPDLPKKNKWHGNVVSPKLLVAVRLLGDKYPGKPIDFISNPVGGDYVELRCETWTCRIDNTFLASCSPGEIARQLERLLHLNEYGRVEVQKARQTGKGGVWDETGVWDKGVVEEILKGKWDGGLEFKQEFPPDVDASPVGTPIEKWCEDWARHELGEV